MLRNIKNRKKLLLVSLPVLVALVAIGWYLYISSRSSPLRSTSSSPTNTQQAVTDGKGANQNTQANTQGKQGQTTAGGQSSSVNKDPVQTPYTPPSSSDKIILSAQQQGKSVVIFTELYGYSEGSCNITVTNGSQQVALTAAVVYQAQYSLCDGFSIPIEKLGNGTWDIVLNVTSYGITTSKELKYAV